MKALVIFAIMSIIPLSLSANGNDLRIVYGELDFYIPSNPSVIGYLGTDKSIIGFSLDKEVNTGGCGPRVFFKSVLNKDASECDAEAVESFRYVFMKHRDSGAWSSGNKEIFYFIGSDKSTVFLVEEGSDNKIYKIESNFLSEKGIKKIFASHL